MKRIFAILLAVTLFCSMAVIPVSAEEVAVSSPWEKLLGETTVTTTTENGETIYSFGNITAAYISAGVDLMPELKTLIEGNDKITVKISFEVKIDYNEGYEDEEYVLGALVRASGTNPKIKEPEAFKAYYKDAQAGAFYDTGGGNYAIRAIEQEVVEGSWTPLEGEMTFTATDIKGGLWEKINFCFDRMSNFESCKTIYIKNTTLELVDYEEGDGEIVVDLDEEIEIPEENETPESEGGAVDTSSVDLTANADAEDTPELPEGNYLDTKWVKGYAANDPIEGTFNDQPMYSMTGWKSAYGSPFLDILPAVKAAMGEEEEITVYIVFDIRAINYKGMEGETHPFGVKIRPKTTDLTKMKEDFEENYFGTNFAHYGEGDVRITLLASDKEEISEDWQRMEFSCTFTADEVEDGLWEAWNLCFDNVSTFKTLGAIQVKNMGVFYEDDYEPIEVEEPKDEGNEGGEEKPATKPSDGTVKDVVLHRPIGGGRYNINFMESVETVVEGGLVDSSNDSAENDGDGEGGMDTTLLIAIIAGVVAVAVIAGVIVVIKKKKSQKEAK